MAGAAWVQPAAGRKPWAACQPLLHPRHARHPRRCPLTLVPCTTRARGHAPVCRVEALANERPCVNDFHRSRDRAAADEQSHRRRIGHGLEGIDIEALPTATAALARHFANDTPRAAAQGPTPDSDARDADGHADGQRGIGDVGPMVRADQAPSSHGSSGPLQALFVGNPC